MLCVAVKRRVHLLHYDGSDFVELKEVHKKNISRVYSTPTHVA